MNEAGIRQMIKNEALNKIRKLYNPKHKVSYSDYEEDGTRAEQRDFIVREIIEKLEKDLNQL